jgi:AraC-like DNA-binding protein
MNKLPARTSGLPLIRLALVAPLIHELKRRNIDYRETLFEFNLIEENIIHGDTFVAAPLMYGLVERLAEVSSDPHFGVRVGEKLDPFSWSPLVKSAELSNTVGEFLLRFLIDAEDDASSVVYLLETKGKRTTFREKRKVHGDVAPKHNDGFTVAFLLTLLNRVLGDHWQGNRVLVRLCDPTVLPAGYLGVRATTTDRFGPSINFPSSWLVLPLLLEKRRRYGAAELERAPIPSQWVEAFRQILQSHVHEFGLSSKRVADVCGLSKRTLARRLQAHGTSVQREVAKIRKTRAQQELVSTDRNVAEIAIMLGYSDTTVFSHAFKRWTGFSPTEYRRRFTVEENAE